MPNANILQHKHDLEGFAVDSKTATMFNEMPSDFEVQEDEV